MVPYTQEILPNWMFAPYSAQEQMILPAQSPSDSTSTGSEDDFTQNFVDIPESSASAGPFENNHLQPPSLVSSPCEATTAVIPNQIEHQNEFLFHLCK